MIRLASAVGRALPEVARVRLFHSRAAPVLRRVLNGLQPDSRRLTIVPLAGCLDGHRMLLDWHTQKAFAFGLYERAVVDVIMRTVCSGWTSVDVGAHIGYYTLLLRKLVGTTGRVVAFEPVPRNFEVLKHNLRLNHYTDVRAEERACAERSGTTTMACRNDDPLTSVSALVEGGDIPVRCVALDDYFIPGERVSFVKVDAEGAELQVLEGMRRILKDSRPVIIVEVHGHRNAHAVSAHLARLGYQFRVIDPLDAASHVLAVPS